MTEGLADFAEGHREALHLLLDAAFSDGRPVLLRSDLVRMLEDVDRGYDRLDLSTGPLAEAMSRAQEAILRYPWVYLAVRERVGRWTFYRLHRDRPVPEEVSLGDFLRFKERLVDPSPADEMLEIDFGPFSRGFPKLTEPRSIGQGVVFLNRQLSSGLFADGKEGLERLHEFLGLHALDGRTLLLERRFEDVPALQAALRRALAVLEARAPDAAWEVVAEPLLGLGFTAGWGSTAGRAAETMSLLVDILEAPSPGALERFLARIPMISRLLVLSPHGYFGQDDVLGLPDTGGQVVYVLDQVRALEREMRERLRAQGVDVEPRILVVTRLIPEAGETTCGERLESVHGCRSTRILRIPFREANGEVVRPWISRFAVWPYLEEFAREVEREAPAELGGRPDLVVGNYSDGNLVAALVAQRLGVTMCSIAHALEKTKYLLSALHWREMEETYHFSCQYTADLIAMNSADFVIASTYQEVAGTATTVGQYESYQFFSMPGLYRVVDGVDPYDPKFNVVSPGADPEIYFPHSETGRRLLALEPQLQALAFGRPGADARGRLAEPARPILLSLARLDRIKNLTGLVEWFASDDALRARANLLVVGGHVDPSRSSDHEEAEQAARMHELFDAHGLDGCVRWVGRRLERHVTGELYRFVADRRGAFVQPALFEAFGLTVVEAMSSGLPTFATCHGGPSEIIEPDRSGYLIDPNDGRSAAAAIGRFLVRCAAEPGEWDRISRGALARVEARYTWKGYAERLMTLSRIYGFWKFVSNLERQETARYLSMLYHLQLRPLARQVGRP